MEPLKNKFSTSLTEFLYGCSFKKIPFEVAVNVYCCTDHNSNSLIIKNNAYYSNAFKAILQGLKKADIHFSEEPIVRKKEKDYPIAETKNITKATNLKRLSNFVAIDTETTGLKCSDDDIIEICAVKFLNFQPNEIFHTYLKPSKPIPENATAINGITNRMVKKAPTFSQIQPSLQNFISDFPIVAHNAHFDMKFLHVSGLDLSQHNGKVYDTLSLSRKKLRKNGEEKYNNYKLAECCRERNIVCENFHSADSDTLACGLLFLDILREIKGVTSVNDLLR